MGAELTGRTMKELRSCMLTADILTAVFDSQLQNSFSGFYLMSQHEAVLQLQPNSTRDVQHAEGPPGHQSLQTGHQHSEGH